MTESFYLLYAANLSSATIKAVALAKDRKISSDEFGVLYELFDSYNRIDKSISRYSQIDSLYNHDCSPTGIPYTYDLCIDGGMFTLFNFGQSKEVVEETKSWLRSAHDVVSLKVRNVNIIDWTPPLPFRRIELPSWIKTGS